MGLVAAFLGAAIAGLGLLLAAVALLAWRRDKDRKMAVLAAAFVSGATGGALFLTGELVGGELQARATPALAASFFFAFVLLYAALFARRA